MKPPIIVYNWGDMLLFGSVEAAEQALEAIDVENGEYLAFDSEGRLLELIADPWNKVSLRCPDPEPRYARQLRRLLTLKLPAAATKRGILGQIAFEKWLRSAPLEALVAEALQLLADDNGPSPG